MKRMKLLFTLALPVVLFQNAQGQSSRLVSQAHLSSNGVSFVLKDTTMYSYTNPRGGDLKNTLKYDHATKWLAADSSLLNDSMMIQEFYSDNTIKATTVQTWNPTSGTWDNKTRTNFWYNSDGTMDYSIYQTWGGSSWTNISKNDYTYGAGRLVRNEYQMWNGVSFDAAKASIYSYDASGNIQQVLYQSYESGFWVYTNSRDYTYTSTNWLSSTKWSNWGGSSFDPISLYSNTYDTTGNLLTTVYQTWNATSGSWDNNMLSVFSNFTSSHMAQTETVQTWDMSGSGSWNNSKLINYEYNVYDQMTSWEAISWNTAGFWQYVLGDGKARYHYEEYTVGVKNVEASAGELVIAPVPANNVINLSLNWKQSQAFTIAIYNVSGALVSYNSIGATSHYNAAIPVDGLATGTYFVKVTGADGQIVRQISIAH